MRRTVKQYLTTMDIQLQSMTASKTLTIQQAVEQYGKKLFDFVRYKVANTEDAEDIIQDVYYQFSKAMDNPEPIEKISSWLFTAARNRIIDLYRKKKPETFTSLLPPETDDEDTLIEPQDFYVSDNNTPEEAYTRKLFWQALQEGLSTLPEEQRLVFEMHELQGMSFNDIADVTGEPIKTLLSRKHYAVKKLRNHLNDFYNETLKDK